MMRIGRKSQDNRKLTAERGQEYNWLMETALKQYAARIERNVATAHPKEKVRRSVNEPRMK
jgi:hypothetical protein